MRLPITRADWQYTPSGRLVPAGPGAGMGILIFPGGLGGIPAGLTGYFIHSIRHAEDILPDREAPPLVEPAY